MTLIDRYANTVLADLRGLAAVFQRQAVACDAPDSEHALSSLCMAVDHLIGCPDDGDAADGVIEAIDRARGRADRLWRARYPDRALFRHYLCVDFSPMLSLLRRGLELRELANISASTPPTQVEMWRNVSLAMFRIARESAREAVV